MTIRRLSDDMCKLIWRLQPPTRFADRYLGQESDRIALLKTIAECKELAAVPCLLPLLFESKEIARAASGAISQLLTVATPDELLSLDKQVRWRADWEIPLQWRSLNVSDLPAFLARIERSVAMLGVLSWHVSGHVREYAVRALADSSDSLATAFLLVRTNDWVEPVRRAARGALVDRLDAGKYEQFFPHLHYVFRLLDCHREDHSGLVTRVVRALVAPESEKELLSALRSPTRDVRRRCYQLAMAERGCHRTTIVLASLRAQDPVLRLWASRDARATLSREELQVALSAMSRDPFLPVRREALITSMELFPERAIADLTGALLESSTSMRQFVRYHLRRLCNLDAAAFYRQAIVAGLSLTNAVAGLGETGTADDAETLFPFLNASSPRLRAAATRAVGRLAPERHLDALVSALQDANKKVSCEAQLAVRPFLQRIDLAILWRLFSAREFHVRWAVLNLICDFGIWFALPYLIEAAADNDERIAGRARHLVSSRSNRIFTLPNAQQREAIDDKLNMVALACPKCVEDCKNWLAALTRSNRDT